MDDTKMTLGPDACSEMLRDLAIRYPKDQYRFRMISFNGSQFDDLFLLQSAVEREETVNATFAGRSMLGL